jgi:asparagine synthetase B (glutamine-hydrolysing)
VITDWLCLFVPEAERAIELRRLRRCPQLGPARLVGDWLVATDPTLASEPQPAPPGLLYSYGRAAHEQQLKRNPERILRLALDQPEHLDQLPGDFSFAALRPGGQATLAAAVCAQGRWHFRSSERRVILSTRQDWLALVQNEPIELSPLGTILAMHAYCGLPELTSTLAGATTLRGGEFACVAPQRSRVSRYWRPLPLRLVPPSPAAADALSERLGHLLKRTLCESQLAAPATQTLVLHSGGLDSSLLVGLTKRFTQARLSAVSLLPPPTDPLTPRERKYQALQASAFESQLELAATEATLSALINPRRLLPGTAFVSLALRAQQHAQGAFSSVMSGYFADEAFGVWRRREWLRGVPITALHSLCLHQASDYPVVRVKLFEWRHRPWGPPLPKALADHYHVALRAGYAQRRNSTALLDGSSPGEYLLLLHELTHVAGSFSEVAKSAGMSAVLPFTSREVLELALATHPALLFRRGLTKVPLRDVGREFLPPEVLGRRDKGNWTASPPLSVPMPTLSSATERLLDSAWLDRQPTVPLRLRLQLQCFEALHQAAEDLSHEQRTYRAH